MSATLTARLPPKTDQRWALLVTQGTTKPLKLLALKFMLSRMNQDVKRDPSLPNINKNADELHQFFVINPRIVESDTTILFS